MSSSWEIAREDSSNASTENCTTWTLLWSELSWPTSLELTTCARVICCLAANPQKALAANLRISMISSLERLLYHLQHLQQWKRNSSILELQTYNEWHSILLWEHWEMMRITHFASPAVNQPNMAFNFVWKLFNRDEIAPERFSVSRLSRVSWDRWSNVSKSLQS